MASEIHSYILVVNYNYTAKGILLHVYAPGDSDGSYPVLDPINASPLCAKHSQYKANAMQREVLHHIVNPPYH